MGAFGCMKGTGILGSYCDISVRFHIVQISEPQGFCIFGVLELRSFIFFSYFGSPAIPRSLLQLVTFVLIWLHGAGGQVSSSSFDSCSSRQIVNGQIVSILGFASHPDLTDLSQISLLPSCTKASIDCMQANGCG